MTTKTILCCDVCSCSIDLASTGVSFDLSDSQEIHICRPCQYDLLTAMLLHPVRAPEQTFHALQAKYQPTLLKETVRGN